MKLNPNSLNRNRGGLLCRKDEVGQKDRSNNRMVGRSWIELYTTVLPAVFLVSVFCRYQIYWAAGILVGITSLAGTPFSRKRGAGCIKKEPMPPFPLKMGAGAPFLRENGIPAPQNDTKMYRPRFPPVSVQSCYNLWDPLCTAR